MKCKTVIFEPSSAMNLECGMIGRSVHLRSNDQLMCNVVNAGTKPLVIKAGTQIGTVCEAVDEANTKFDADVEHYKE